MQLTTVQRKPGMESRIAEGGPFHGQRIRITKEEPRTAMVFTVNGHTGHYEVNPSGGPAVWYPKQTQTGATL